MDWDQDFDSDQDYFERTLSIMVDQLHAHLEDGDLTQAELIAAKIKLLET
jgi:hypothetical protein